MIYDRPRKPTASLTVLRLAVAGILAWAGYNHFTAGAAPPRAESPITDAAGTPAIAPTGQASLPINEAATGTVNVPVPASEQPAAVDAARTAVSPDGVKLNMGWDDVVGAGELGMAAVLLSGLFVRLFTFLGAGAIAAVASAAHGLTDLPDWTDPLLQAYQANPAAALLLGAIFLALLVGGSGPVAIDRVFESRRRRLKEASGAIATA
jgi:uncharacterized membrane protein YphA (DoxX/SURF4 family)